MRKETTRGSLIIDSSFLLVRSFMVCSMAGQLSGGIFTQSSAFWVHWKPIQIRSRNVVLLVDMIRIDRNWSDTFRNRTIDFKELVMLNVGFPPKRVAVCDVNGNVRIRKWRYCTLLLAIFCEDIPLRYLQWIGTTGNDSSLRRFVKQQLALLDDEFRGAVWRRCGGNDASAWQSRKQDLLQLQTSDTKKTVGKQHMNLTLKDHSYYPLVI